MHLIIVGSKAKSAIEIHYMNYLMKNGLCISFFDPSIYYKLDRITDKIKFRYFPKDLFEQANQALIKLVDEILPDMIWIFKGIEIFPDTLEKLRRRNVFLINYNPDHPFIRTYTSNGGRNIEDCVPLYNLHFCYSIELVNRIHAQFQISSNWLPFGYDLSNEEFQKIQNVEEVKKVCFVGNPDKIRANTIKAIVSKGIEVDVYGYNWSKYISKGNNIRIFDLVFGFDYWSILRKYKLQINIFRPHNINSHNMRTFEIPACGGIQAAPQSNENELFFETGKEIFLYRNIEELIEIIHDVMKMSSDQIHEIRESARARVVRDHCSYEYRAQYVADILKSL